MFDNPFIWIVAIWWLLSNFLGKSKRRRVRQVEPVPMEESDEALYDGPDVEGPAIYPGPQTAEPAPDGPAPGSQPVDPQVPPPAAPLRPTLKDLWRTLEREIEGVTQAVAPVPSAPPKVAIVPPPPPARSPVAPPEQAHKQHDTATWGKKTTYRQPLERYSPRWTVTQRAVIFREILGPPLALRRTRQR